MGTNLSEMPPDCDHWNHIPVNKNFIEQPSSEPKVEVMIPMYEPLQMSKCKNVERQLQSLKN